jgi:hypothetical protein
MNIYIIAVDHKNPVLGEHSFLHRELNLINGWFIKKEQVGLYLWTLLLRVTFT